MDIEFSYSELIGECKTNDDCDTAHEFCQVSDHSCRSLSGQLYFPFLFRVSRESYYMICMYNIYLKILIILDLNWCCKQLHKYQVTLKSWGSLPKANRTMWNSYACGTLVGGKEKYGETCAGFHYFLPLNKLIINLIFCHRFAIVHYCFLSQIFSKEKHVVPVTTHPTILIVENVHPV